MILTQKKILESKNSTVSHLHCGNDFLGFVLEDGHRSVKIPKVTRIPGGRFPLRAITWGKFYARYKAAYGHKFAIEVGNVPNFKYIRFHQGIHVTHTDGCLLNCHGFEYDDEKDVFYATETEKAYLNFYEYIRPAFEKELEIWLDIHR